MVQVIQRQQSGDDSEGLEVRGDPLNVARSDKQADSVRAGRLEPGASTWTGS